MNRLAVYGYIYYSVYGLGCFYDDLCSVTYTVNTHTVSTAVVI